MPLRALFLGVLMLAALTTVRADPIVCPDLTAAVRVGTCPSEEELQYTYMGYCSDNARLYARDDDECASYQAYRRLKNIVLWESADGEFSGYVSCDLPEAGLRGAKAQSVKVAMQGKITRLICGYGEGISLTHRTRAACQPTGGSSCSGPACRADCR